MPIIVFDFDTEADALRARVRATGSVYAYESFNGRYWEDKQLTISAQSNLYGNATVDGTTYVGAAISALSSIGATATQIAGLRATITAAATIGGEYQYGDGRATLPGLVSFGSDRELIQGVTYLGPFTNEAYITSFTPLKTTIGYGFLLGLTGVGVSVDPQIGEGYLNPLVSKGWLRDATDEVTGDTGDGYAYLPCFFTFGFEGSRLEVTYIDTLFQFPYNIGYGLYNELLESNLTLTSVFTDLLASSIYLEEFSSDLTLTDVYNTFALGLETFESSVNLTSLLDHLKSLTEEFSSTLALSSSFADSAVYFNEFISTVTLTDIYELYRKITAEVLSNLSLTDALTPIVNFLATVNSNLTLNDYYSKDVEDVPEPTTTTTRTWAVNIENSASSQYDAYGFTSFAEYDGVYYATADDGIYTLTGDTDAGLPIAALVEFALSRFATPQKKYFPSIYLGVTSEGQMLVKAVVDGQAWVYTANNTTSNMANQRVDIGRGLSGSHWQFTLLNEDGVDFDLESVEFLPFISSRRVY
jgi:hypothetical protein